MSPRARALGFGAGALACAALAAAAAGSARSSAEQRYGELRDVVIATAALHAGQTIAPNGAKQRLTTRRVPAGFAPPDALGDPAQALGGRLRIAIPAGSYLTRTLLGADAPRSKRPRALANGRSPVEIIVAGGAAIASTPKRSDPRVDVVVTSEPGPGPRAGRTYLAARSVPLLELRRDRQAETVSGEGGWVATLALARGDALRLIRAESFARSIRLLAR